MKTKQDAMQNNMMLATKDVLLPPVAIQFLAKMLDKKDAQEQLLLFVTNSLQISTNTNNALKRKPKDVSLLNVQHAKKLVVFSNTEANVTMQQKLLANH